MDPFPRALVNAASVNMLGFPSSRFPLKILISSLSTLGNGRAGVGRAFRFSRSCGVFPQSVILNIVAAISSARQCCNQFYYSHNRWRGAPACAAANLRLAGVCEATVKIHSTPNPVSFT